MELKFNEWKKMPKHRFYVSAGDMAGSKSYIELGPSGKIKFFSPVEGGAETIKRALEHHGFPLSLPYTTTSHLGATLKEFGLLSKAGNYKSNSSFSSEANDKKSDAFSRFPLLQDLQADAKRLTANTAPFRSKSIKDVAVYIQPQEYGPLGMFIDGAKLEVSQTAHIPCDILFRSESTGAELLIERKTIADLRQSVFSSHAHDQAERMWEYAAAKAKKGEMVMVAWVTEGDDSGLHAYSALPRVKQMDGWLGYICGILGQHHFQSFSKEHTVYLSLKLAQAFFEKELYYPVKSDNGRKINKPFNMSSKDRMSLGSSTPGSKDSTEDKSGSGVSRLSRFEDFLGYLPGVSMAAAKSLADAGLSIADICSLGEAELQSYPNIGPKTASALYAALHSVKKDSATIDLDD